MISCHTFRATLKPADNSPEILEHLRTCDLCLDYAVSVDGDNLFRSIGGNDLVPPGGIDNFAADVMAQIHLRQAEGSVARRFLVAPKRLAAAAAIVVAIGAGYLAWEQSDRTAPVAVHAAAQRKQLATKPIVETYESRNATIVEVPNETNDVKVVMIFDESLPADL